MGTGKLNCNVVRDLLPLYCDELTSEETNVEIKAHLESCKDCMGEYEVMKQGFDADKENMEKKGAGRNPFKKVKKRVTIKHILAFILGVILCIGFVWVAFVGVIKFDSSDITIKYKAFTEDNGYGQTQYCVTFDVSSPKGTILNEWTSGFERKDGVTLKETIGLYHVLKIPFDDRGEEPNTYSAGYSDEKPFTDNYIVEFECGDKTLTYSLKDIAEDAGIQ